MPRRFLNWSSAVHGSGNLCSPPSARASVVRPDRDRSRPFDANPSNRIQQAAQPWEPRGSKESNAKLFRSEDEGYRVAISPQSSLTGVQIWISFSALGQGAIQEQGFIVAVITGLWVLLAGATMLVVW